MTVNILHLYPDELNLYGENGNLKALKYLLEKENIKVNILSYDINSKLDFKDINFIYMGSGRPEFLAKAKEHLKLYREELSLYLKQDKIMLITGSALSTLDFLSLYEVEKYDTYKVADVTATTSLCPGVIKAFQNTQYLIKNTNNLIFNLESGYGNNNTMLEGFKYHNLYVTSLIGPILARNDELTKYFIDLLKENKA